MHQCTSLETSVVILLWRQLHKRKRSAHYELSFSFSLCKTFNQTRSLLAWPQMLRMWWVWKLRRPDATPSSVWGLQETFNLLHIPNAERVMWVDAKKFLNDKTKGCLAVEFIYFFLTLSSAGWVLAGWEPFCRYREGLVFFPSSCCIHPFISTHE